MVSEKRIITPSPVYSTRLVKSEDLNHHGTLFAGRTAEWFIEAGYIAAASIQNPVTIVCQKVHGMYFSKPAYPGDILRFESKIVYAGRNSLIANVKVMVDGLLLPLVEGFLTFIHVNKETKPVSHNIVIQPETAEDMRLYEEASLLKIK